MVPNISSFSLPLVSPRWDIQTKLFLFSFLFSFIIFLPYETLFHRGGKQKPNWSSSQWKRACFGKTNHKKKDIICLLSLSFSYVLFCTFVAFSVTVLFPPPPFFFRCINKRLKWPPVRALLNGVTDSGLLWLACAGKENAWRMLRWTWGSVSGLGGCWRRPLCLWNLVCCIMGESCESSNIQRWSFMINLNVISIPA